MSDHPSQSFHAPQRVLLGPGPSNLHQRVLAALAQSPIGLDDPQLSVLWDDLRSLLHYLFQTRNDLTFAFAGSGMGGMESSVVNLIEPGDKVVVGVAGVFGEALRDRSLRAGAEVVAVEEAWGRPIDPGKVEDALKRHAGVKALLFVHAETSTGVESDAAALCGLARRYGALSIVDAVTSLGGTPVDVDGWQADAVFSASQKCLSSTPGLSPLTFSPRALQAFRRRKQPVQSFYMDLGHLLAYLEAGNKGFNFHKNPMNSLFALHEALTLIREEGLDAVWTRHRQSYQVLKAGIDALGLRYLAEESCRLPQVTAVLVPQGIDDGLLRARLLQRFNIALGGGIGALAGKIWRIGLMGQGASPRNALLALSALEATLGELGYPLSPGAAVAAATAVLAEQAGGLVAAAQ